MSVRRAKSRFPSSREERASRKEKPYSDSSAVQDGDFINGRANLVPGSSMKILPLASRYAFDLAFHEMSAGMLNGISTSPEAGISKELPKPSTRVPVGAETTT